MLAGKQNSLSLLETTQLCEQITGKTIPIKSITEERQGDVPIFITDSSQIIEKTEWTPKINPQQTLKDIYQWIKDNEGVLKPILS